MQCTFMLQDIDLVIILLIGLWRCSWFSMTLRVRGGSVVVCLCFSSLTDWYGLIGRVKSGVQGGEMNVSAPERSGNGGAEWQRCRRNHRGTESSEEQSSAACIQGRRQLLPLTACGRLLSTNLAHLSADRECPYGKVMAGLKYRKCSIRQNVRQTVSKACSVYQFPLSSKECLLNEGHPQVYWLFTFLLSFLVF